MKKSLNQTLHEKDNQQFISVLKSVFQIFSEIQKTPSLNKSHVFQLIKIHNSSPSFFDKAFEQAYLKIFKCFHEKANKKIPSKFQSLADMLFKEILKQKNLLQQSKQTLNSFLNLLAEAIYSSIMNVRVMASRILFVLLKSLPSEESIQYYLQLSTQNQIAKSILFMIKQKVSTYRQLGIKLCSLGLIMISQAKINIEKELFKILATQQNQHIRKMVITNMPLTEDNIDRVFVRLRDKNPEIRATLIRRLLSDQFRLEKMKLNNRYKLLYDGFGTKDIISKEESFRYFASFFTMHRQSMEEQNKFSRFVDLFQPNLLLVNSHLYLLLNRLIGEIMTLLPQSQICQYIRKLCIKVKLCQKDRKINLSSELIWLKNSSIIKPELKAVNNVFEQFGPSGMQLSSILMVFFQQKNIFAINQFLQLFSNMSMPDEIGRNKMFDTLKDALIKLPYYVVKLDLSEIHIRDDICNIQTQQQIKLKKFMLSYYDIPIISDSTDLINPIVAAMKILRPQTYIREFQETISDWTDPQNTIFKQKITTQLNLKCLQSELQQKNPKTINLLKTLTQKLNKVERQIELQNYKTLTCIAAISRVKYDWDIDPYISMIKDQLVKEDQSYGLLLLGLYCLQNAQKVSFFLPLFWFHIMKETPKQVSINQQQCNKLHLLISLKVMSDFIVKFNILNSPQIMQNTATEQTSQYNPDTFMQRVTELILCKDPEIKIYAIECLCRMIYHNRVDENNISTYFLYLLLLWWQTNLEEISAKSVHTISLFFRSYLDKGNEQVAKLAEMLCIFHKILKIFEEKNKTINKNLIVYNLKMNEFIKKTVGIATTVLKYHKEKKTIWIYKQPEIGPQEFFLLYLLYEPGFQNILERPFTICDFYTKCPLQTLILVKKKVEQFRTLVQQDMFFPSNYKYDKVVTKKSLEEMSRFQKQIESHISVKNQQTFNPQIISQLEKIFAQSATYINLQAKRIAKNIEEQQIFVNIDEDYVDSEEENINEIQENQQSQEEPESDCLNISQNLSNQGQNQSSSNTESLNRSMPNPSTRKNNNLPLSRKQTRSNSKNTQNNILKANKPIKPQSKTSYNKNTIQQVQSQLQQINSSKQSSESGSNSVSIHSSSSKSVELQKNKKNNNNRNIKKRIPKLMNFHLNLKEENSEKDKKNSVPVRKTRASKLA